MQMYIKYLNVSKAEKGGERLRRRKNSRVCMHTS